MTDERRPEETPPESPAKTTTSTVPSPSDSGGGPDREGRTRQMSREARFLQFASDAVDVFPAADGQAYGRGRSQWGPVTPVAGLVDELAQQFYAEHFWYPAVKDRANVVDFLRGRAKLAPVRPVHLRSAWLPEQGEVVIDTGHDDEVIIVSDRGWRPHRDAPVAFRRVPTTAQLVVADKPVSQEEGLALIRELIPVDWRDVPLLIAALLTAWLTGVPQPIVLLIGPRDSGKTSTARFVLSLVDPTTHLRGGGLPPNEAGWKALANTASAHLIDNLGHVTPATSDLLCRVASGGELTTRALYTNDTAHVTTLQVPLWFTSVDPGVLREDLASRIVRIRLTPLTSDVRLPESELRRRQDAARPRLTRFLLDVLVDVLAAMPQVDRSGLTHRMGDFELVLRCVDQLLGTSGVDRLAEQSVELAIDVLESDPVAQALIRWADSALASPVTTKECTPTTLLDELTELVSDTARGRSWPRSPGVLTTHLNRIAPTLEEVHGLRVTTGLRTGKHRTRSIRIERVVADDLR